MLLDGVRPHLLIKHAFNCSKSQVQFVLSIMYRASENSWLKKIASFVVPQRRQGTTAGCQKVVGVRALFFLMKTWSGCSRMVWITSSLNAYKAVAMKRQWRKLCSANSVGRLMAKGFPSSWSSPIDFLSLSGCLDLELNIMLRVLFFLTFLQEAVPAWTGDEDALSWSKATLSTSIKRLRFHLQLDQGRSTQEITR